MGKRALCLLCGTDLKDGKPVIIDDLLKLIEDMKNEPETRLHGAWWAEKIENIIKGE